MSSISTPDAINRAETVSPGSSIGKPRTSNPHATFDTVAGENAVTTRSDMRIRIVSGRVAIWRFTDSIADSPSHQTNHFEYRCRIVGMRYSSNAREKSCAGLKPQSARAVLSSTSAGHESTMAWRFGSTAKVIAALGNAFSTTARMSSADRLNAATLYAVRVSFPTGAADSVSSASIASGIAMNGIVVSGRTKHAYGSPRAAA